MISVEKLMQHNITSRMVTMRLCLYVIKGVSNGQYYLRMCKWKAIRSCLHDGGAYYCTLTYIHGKVECQGCVTPWRPLDVLLLSSLSPLVSIIPFSQFNFSAAVVAPAIPQPAAAPPAAVPPHLQCSTPGCPRPKYPNPDGGYFDYCSRYCRNNQGVHTSGKEMIEVYTFSLHAVLYD